MKMKFRVYNEDQQPISNWSGGKTKELAIFPEGSAYLDRDFIWRLSTASSDREESSFSRLEGFDRILMVLEGDVVLAHGQDRSVHLGQMEQDTFDGGIKTRCFGQLTKDYNLIMARGCEGSLNVMELTQDAKAIDDLGDNTSAGPKYRSFGIYCMDGYAVVSAGDKTEMIKPDSQAVIDIGPGEEIVPTVMGEGSCIIAEVAFGADAEGAYATADMAVEEGVAGTQSVTGASEAVSGGSFASEYGTCLRLFARSNRWSKMLRRQGSDKVYYDKALSKALEKIERRYITPIVWLLGCMACFLPAFTSAKLGLCAGLACGFTVIHLIVIAPFIYWKMLPKPVSSHIKSTDELNAFEKMHHEEDIARDPHFDRLMSKYSSDDENYFTDENSPLYRLVKKK